MVVIKVRPWDQCKQGFKLIEIEIESTVRSVPLDAVIAVLSILYSYRVIK